MCVLLVLTHCLKTIKSRELFDKHTLVIRVSFLDFVEYLDNLVAILVIKSHLDSPPKNIPENTGKIYKNTGDESIIT